MLSISKKIFETNQLKSLKAIETDVRRNNNYERIGLENMNLGKIGTQEAESLKFIRSELATP